MLNRAVVIAALTAAIVSTTAAQAQDGGSGQSFGRELAGTEDQLRITQQGRAYVDCVRDRAASAGVSPLAVVEACPELAEEFINLNIRLQGVQRIHVIEILPPVRRRFYRVARRFFRQ